jgi:hypothetical protein
MAKPTVTTTYTATATNNFGCSSSSLVTLMIIDSSVSNNSVIACGSYTWNGTTYTSSGSYTYNTINAAGCDSIAILDLVIQILPEAGTVNGAKTICVGSDANFSITGGDVGGTWISTNTSIATVTTSGIVTPLADGTTSIYYVINSISCGSDTARMSITVNPCNSYLNMKAFIQGYYDAYTGTMATALANSGIGSSTSIADSITVEIRDTTTGALIVSPVKAMLQTNGTIHALFPALTGSHYVVLKHRNAIETWSANPIVLDSTATYDFSVAANKAYGANMVNVAAAGTIPIYAIWSGDLNQDGVIESSDYLQMENDILTILFGYQISDLTGDGIVESLDYLMMENNLLKVIFTSKPF